ncbi:hypothetical protein Droror1_Dr00025844 [Drosera rotundifolia]
MWERVAALPCLTKIPADELYFNFVYTYPCSLEDPKLNRTFLYKLTRKSVVKLPADMITKMLVTLTTLFCSSPESDKALAKVIITSIISRMKTQDRAIRFLFKIQGVPYPQFPSAWSSSISAFEFTFATESNGADDSDDAATLRRGQLGTCGHRWRSSRNCLEKVVVQLELPREDGLLVVVRRMEEKNGWLIGFGAAAVVLN